MSTRSLSSRIITLSGFWVTMALVVVALLLIYFYRDHVESHYDAHVHMHLEELTGGSQLLPDGSFSLAFLPSDPRYNELNSGWYWEVRRGDNSLMKSPSLGSYVLNTDNIKWQGNDAVYEIPGPVNQPLRVHMVQSDADPGDEPLVYLSTAPSTDYKDDVLNYSNHIISSFVLLGIGLLLTVVLQVRTALKPLKAIGSEIGEVRGGTRQKLSSDYPLDVQPLVNELNNLLDHNVVLLRRARNQLGDLAHSVKNPLSVINNEARNMLPEQKVLIQKQTRDIIENIDHYLSRARTFGTEKIIGSKSNVKTVVEDLVYTMQRLYQQRQLVYDYSGLKDCVFRGEAQDLEEMLGNLIDNSSKWATSRVTVSGESIDGRLRLVIIDDGPGIPDEEIENVKRRGHKLDETKPGHGQGLGIVNDIAKLYGGSLIMSASESGGLRAELDLPGV